MLSVIPLDIYIYRFLLSWGEARLPQNPPPIATRISRRLSARVMKCTWLSTGTAPAEYDVTVGKNGEGGQRQPTIRTGGAF